MIDSGHEFHAWKLDFLNKQFIKKDGPSAIKQTKYQVQYSPEDQYELAS